MCGGEGLGVRGSTPDYSECEDSISLHMSTDQVTTDDMCEWTVVKILRREVLDICLISPGKWPDGKRRVMFAECVLEQRAYLAPREQYWG